MRKKIIALFVPIFLFKEDILKILMSFVIVFVFFNPVVKPLFLKNDVKIAEKQKPAFYKIPMKNLSGVKNKKIKYL